MELSENIKELNSLIDNLIFEEMWLSKAAYWLLGLMCLVFFIVAIVNLIRRKWNSLFLVFICLFTFTWALFSLFALNSNIPLSSEYYNAFRLIIFIPIPALLALHIHRQVSYKPVRLIAIAFYLLVPAFLVFVYSRDLQAAYARGAVFVDIFSGWYLYLFGLYAVVSIINSYLLCFNVFYQMPLRARRSTRSMLVSVIILMLLLVSYAAWKIGYVYSIPQDSVTVDIILPTAIAAALIIFIYPLFDSMYIMPAADVIVTSREFVMKALSTTVLVLNRNQLILDWNKKDWTLQNPLPKPIYKESYRVYLERVMKMSAGKVSPHNADIFILKSNDNEYHFMQRIGEVGNKRSMMGYIVEIAEVSPLYTKLRYFEEIAHFDTLTGLYNRNAYIDYMKDILNDSNFPLLVLVADLNKLKQTNDVHGHIEGDNFIKCVADSIARIKPDNAFLARVGGDEFVLLIPHGSAEFAEKFISRAIEACGSVPHSAAFVPGASWGYALMTSNEQSYNDVFAEADKMMYEFKKSRIEFSSSGILPQKN
ncbi:MAG: GGDEF domain-containing protein [Oscillospiraceae bacterium]|nr:GGDEF domain-containing protein [Oscillospiraceae bacterium]MCL2278438.1 GGDEF domain-containing protein [Oscillospiraceae bacterium]